MSPSSRAVPLHEDQFDGFVHVADGQLVDGSGAPLTLRGVGVGNWLLTEGYMWKFEPGGPLSGRQIEAFVDDLVGPARCAQFWTRFRDGYITEADIERVAQEGLNHIRIAVNARGVLTDSGELLEDGFALIDRCIDWCRAHGLYVVLDLHGAPGGQTGTNIDDSPRGLPDLFTDPAYPPLTVELWRAIATRYRHETVVAGYDLLNEPLPNEYQQLYADELVELYAQLTAAIRSVDPDHLIIYEGTHWSTNWDIFTEVWDANSMLQCHKYWSPPDLPSVRRYLERGQELGLPVYMGETGENNLDWMQVAFELYEHCGMSWNLWPWKKLETVTSPCSVDAPPGWDAVVAYARGQGPKPSADEAWAVLEDLLERIDITRCTYRPDVVNTILRRAPLRIPAWGFGFDGPGVSYQSASSTPLAGFRADDHVTLRCGAVGADGAPAFAHGDGAPRSDQDAIVVELAPGDWVAYNVETAAAGGVRVAAAFDVAAGPRDESSAEIFLDGTALPALTANHDGVEGTSTTLPAGSHVVRVGARNSPISLRWVDIAPSTP